MCRALYLLTERPLSAEALAWEDESGVELTLVKAASLTVPRKVRKISHGPIYYVHSSQGCGCGFEADISDDEYEVAQLQANMQGLGRLLRRVAQEQPNFQICTGWDFAIEVQPRQIALEDVEKQRFSEEWDWLGISTSNQTESLT